MPSPQFVMSAEGHRIATYSWGEEPRRPVLCVHGFASSCRDNWVNTGWVRDLTRAGFRVLGVDQRGHGASDKPHDPRDYTMDALVGDLLTVLDTYLLDTVLLRRLLARRPGRLAVRSWTRPTASRARGARRDPRRPAARAPQIEQARAYAERGIPVEDRVTQNYVTLAERVPGNDLRRARRARRGDAPRRRRSRSRASAAAARAVRDRQRGRDPRAVAGPGGGHAARRFRRDPGRHHFNAPGSRVFREAAVEFLAGGA